VPNPEKGYFAVDVHPNVKGQALISELLTKELVSGAVPALKPTTQVDPAISPTR
jgi:hypothetical protein